MTLRNEQGQETGLKFTQFRECAVLEVLEKIALIRRLRCSLKEFSETELLDIFMKSFGKDHADERALEEVPIENAYAIKFPCTYQICHADGLSRIGGGSSAVGYEKYSGDKMIFIGQPTKAFTCRKLFYMVYYPNGIKILDGPCVQQEIFMAIRRDTTLLNGKIIREPPRYWQF